MTIHGYTQRSYDSCVYFRRLDARMIYLLLYVDYMLIATKNMSDVISLKKLLSSELR